MFHSHQSQWSQQQSMQQKISQNKRNSHDSKICRLHKHTAVRSTFKPLSQINSYINLRWITSINMDRNLVLFFPFEIINWNHNELSSTANSKWKKTKLC